MRFVNANYKEVGFPNEWLTFDDVLLLPQQSDIISRNSPLITLETKLSPWLKLTNPIISANMDTITESKMAIAMSQLGCLGIHHRFYKTVELFLEDLEKSTSSILWPSFSIGNKETDLNVVEKVLSKYVSAIICIDVAHGHLTETYNQIKRLRDRFGNNVEIIAGNVATSDGVKFLVEAGATVVKCGIGGGSLCLSRIVAGHGVPQLSAIINCRRAIKELGTNTGLIADGGIRNSGDIVKALAAGADAVMLGGLLAGTDEAPGGLYFKRSENYFKCKTIEDFHETDFFKKYRGQASRDFMSDYGKEGVSPEGESMYVPSKGSVVPLVKDLLGGVRSGLSYSGAHSIKELQEKSQFIKISGHSFVEGTAHGKK